MRLRYSRAAVHLRAATEPGENCRSCIHMLPDGDCQIVIGKVKPKDVCDLWKGK